MLYKINNALKKALRLLRQEHLEPLYKEANLEVDNDFEGTSLDGVEQD